MQMISSGEGEVPRSEPLAPDLPFGSPTPGFSDQDRTEGSGFFVASNGYIITNTHLVERASEVDVITSDGKSLPAKVVGADAPTDVALLKVDGSDFPFVTFASTQPRVGDWVIVMGYPFGLSETATAGIISASGRALGDGPSEFLQVDAPMNHGNGGSPTFNSMGEVVGVATTNYSPSGGNIGIGFAIPADIVAAVFAQLKGTGHVTRGAIGAQIQPVTRTIADALGLGEPRGALIDQTDPAGPAANAGLALGDVITMLDGKAVVDSRDLANRIGLKPPGSRITLGFLRNGVAKTADLTLAALPAKEVTAVETGDGNGMATLGMKLVPQAGSQTNGVIVGEVDRAARANHKTMSLLRIRSGDQTRFVAVPVA
jgi:serine protease Do